LRAAAQRQVVSLVADQQLREGESRQLQALASAQLQGELRGLGTPCQAAWFSEGS